MTVQDLQNRLYKIEGYRNALQSQKNDIEENFKSLKKETELLTKTSAVLKHLLDVMIKDGINKMSNLITYGLKTVFYDQNLSFHPIITKKGEKIHIELKTSDKEVDMDFGSFGGSVAVVESFLLRILCLLKMNLGKLILLDETFGPIGPEYIPNMCELVNELSQKLGLDILLVTQRDEFINHVENAYRVSETPTGVIMEKVK